ncbi:MAG: O-antigen ligase family protein [Flavobacterium sp.]|nr:O-antigen ligase family protein [Flavobacterium sp.]
MIKENRFYTALVLGHIALAVIVFILPVISKLYAFAILIVGIAYIIKRQNKNNEALLVAAYITGSEVFLRCTDGVPVYEFSKYAVVLVIFIGMFFSGFSKNAIPYWIYILLLIPSVILATFVLNNSIEDRKIISFVISGPLCLGIASLYTYQRKISYNNMNLILLGLALPVISLAVFLILYNPSVRDVITGTDSNTTTSGGFGPNQVSTALGLGIFVFISRAILQSKTLFITILNLSLAAIFTFRAIVTFSRGGIATAAVMVLILIAGLYLRFNYRAKVKLHYFIVGILLGVSVIWSYSLVQTNGLIANRYANEDAAGRVKESKFSGREELAESEMSTFYANPIFGVGVGKSIEIRKTETGVDAASHNEITRLLAEHGALGILILLILFITPIFLHLDNRENFFMFPILFFWLLTINHAAMRIAAPAFVYSLALLKVYITTPVKVQKEV